MRGGCAKFEFTIAIYRLHILWKEVLVHAHRIRREGGALPGINSRSSRLKQLSPLLSSPSYARPPVNVTNGDGKKISLPHQI